MSPIRLDENGLSIPTQEENVAELVARLRARFGENLDVEPTESIMGQLIQELSELRSLDHQQFLSIYRSIDPNGAMGRALDARLALTGSARKGATHSFVHGVLTFSSAGTMNNGDLIRNDDNGTLWQLTDGPHTSAGPWPEQIAAQMTAVDTGPILAQAGTTWSAVTAVTGLDGFTNPTDDANVGRDREADAAARTRRITELHKQGQGPLKAIQGVVSAVDGVVYARVYHNPSTSPVDADGIPFKAFNVVVETQPSTPTAAQQQAIFDAIWSATGAGGEAHGTDYVGTVIDSEGTAQPVAFDTIDDVDVNIEVDLITAGSEDPITPNLAAVVKERILEVAVAELAKHGRDTRRVDISGIIADMLDDGEISGPYDAVVRLSRGLDPVADVPRVEIGIREKPDFDSANITVLVDGS